jgi:hypothetical protein
MKGLKMTLEKILETHAAAGSRYAAAAGELHDALIELSALDAVLMSEGSGHDGRIDMRTFFDVPQNLGTLAHPKFAPLDGITCWRDEIKARRDELLASLEA